MSQTSRTPEQQNHERREWRAFGSPVASCARFAALLLCCVAALGTTAQPANHTASGDLPGRLAALSPNHPEAYFELAEEVADTANSIEDESLAKTLYVLAFELDRRPGRPGTLAASAALGIAKVERLDRDRRWLSSLAAAIDRRYSLPDWNVGAGATISD